MSFRNTIAAAIVLLALGAYIYKYEREPVPSTEDSEREKVFALEEKQIREIEIQRPDAESLKVQKTGDAWKIVSPIEAPADTVEVESLSRNIATLERERVIAEGDSLVLGDFGLEDARLHIRFTAETLDAPSELLIGKKTPTGSNLYAKLGGENRVFVIPAYLENTFDKKAWDLRDKRVFDFSRDDVERLILKRPQGQVILARAGEDLWNVTTPTLCRADRYKASSLVSRLETTKMEELVSEGETDSGTLSSYGLSNPRYEVEVQLKGGHSARLMVGNEKGGRYYARNPERPLVYLIASSLVDDLKKDSGEYRSKRLFDFAAYQVDKFRIAPRGESLRNYVKETVGADSGEASWKQTEPETRELERSKVDDLLYKLNGTDAQDFAADTAAALAPFGLDEPAYTITVWSKEQKMVEEVIVGTPEGEWVYARRKGDDPILKLARSSWDELEKLMRFEAEEGAEDKDSTGEES